jgi:hypothetical protein
MRANPHFLNIYIFSNYFFNFIIPNIFGPKLRYMLKHVYSTDYLTMISQLQSSWSVRRNMIDSDGESVRIWEFGTFVGFEKNLNYEGRD